ncbi:unnamed protein product [Gadus morhua 'NCC']
MRSRTGRTGLEGNRVPLWNADDQAATSWRPDHFLFDGRGTQLNHDCFHGFHGDPEFNQLLDICSSGVVWTITSPLLMRTSNQSHQKSPPPPPPPPRLLLGTQSPPPSMVLCGGTREACVVFSFIMVACSIPSNATRVLQKTRTPRQALLIRCLFSLCTEGTALSFQLAAVSEAVSVLPRHGAQQCLCVSAAEPSLSITAAEPRTGTWDRWWSTDGPPYIMPHSQLDVKLSEDA